jgi:superoxide reductase
MSDAPILGPINVVGDFAAADDFAKKHTPFIELAPHGDKTLVCVTVGHQVPHPNQPDHYIGWVMLLANDAPIARADFSPVATESRVEFIVSVDKGTRLRAMEHCNLHGLWAMEVLV